jgi:hypothetical protein
MTDHETLEKLVQQWRAMATANQCAGSDMAAIGYVRCADELASLLTLVREDGPRLREQHWQPIDTAPTDGSTILLTDGTYIRTGYWAKRIDCWSVDAVGQLPMPTMWAPTPRSREDGPRDQKVQEALSRSEPQPTREHGDPRVDPNQLFRCPGCGFETLDSLAMSTHVEECPHAPRPA